MKVTKLYTQKRVCAVCGKGVMIHLNVSHAKNRTRKVSKPNLHKMTINFQGRPTKVRVCTNCRKKLQRPVVKPKPKGSRAKVV